MSIKKVLLVWAVSGLIVGTILIITALSPLFSPYIPLVTPPQTPIASPSALPATSNQIPATNTFLVTHVYDGDTFEIESGEKVRLIGVDTPETVDPHRPDGCYGKEASDKTKAILTNQRVRLEKDITDKDKYSRILRYVFLPSDSTTSAIFYNDFLVKEGYAKSYPYPPDTKYQELFNRSQQEAKLNKKGLWGKCSN